MLRKFLRAPLAFIGYELRRSRPKNPLERNIPDGELYRPLFSPWLGQGDFERYYALAAPKTLVSADRCYVLWILLRQALNISGDIWECGVYKGGTAAMMADEFFKGSTCLPLCLPTGQAVVFKGVPDREAGYGRMTNVD